MSSGSSWISVEDGLGENECVDLVPYLRMKKHQCAQQKGICDLGGADEEGRFECTNTQVSTLRGLPGHQHAWGI